MSNHFNELLLQRLEEVGLRLDRLEGPVDHVINEKADKTDVKDVKADVKGVQTDVKDVKSDVDTLRDEVRSHGQRLDRIERKIKTLQLRAYKPNSLEDDSYIDRGYF